MQLAYSLYSFSKNCFPNGFLDRTLPKTWTPSSTPSHQGSIYGRRGERFHCTDHYVNNKEREPLQSCVYLCLHLLCDVF
jgi:hypothetical protein